MTALHEPAADAPAPESPTPDGPAPDSADGYAPPGEDRPLRGYAVAMGTYGALTAGVVALARRRGRSLPEVTLRDLALFGLATHRASRLLTKDAVTSPLRAPFTRYESPGAPSELNESVRAQGSVGHAVGELLTCPFCLGQWVATGFVAGSVFAPRATRLVAAVFAAVGISDFLQYAYAGAGKLAE